jgi:hypothetical protein
LKDGSSVSGRIVEETPARLKLVASGPVEHVLARSDIASDGGKPKIRTSELSLMPEGLEAIPDKDFRDMIWFLLNPPGDNRPMSPALRRELLGEETSGQKKSASVSLPVDLESVALWNPDWRVTCPPFEGAPAKLSEYAGRKNVLMTHPTDRNTPAALDRFVEVPAGQRTVLTVDMASHEQGDWELRVLADGQLLRQELIRSGTEGHWQTVNVDLTRFAGKRIALRLENAPNGWAWEFAFWGQIELKSEALRVAR